MFGAIIGDISGSRFELHNHKSKDFEIFDESCHPTDDSVMTLAVANALLKSLPAAGEPWDLELVSNNAIRCMRELGRKYPDAGYGGNFRKWIFSERPEPYGSIGNGAAMRVSPVAYMARNLKEVKELSHAVTAVTHNSDEAFLAAEAVAVCILEARSGKSLEEIRERVLREYYPIDFTIDEIRPDYAFDGTCGGSVPQALEAFFESESFEDALRVAVSLGGDTDTIAAIACSVASEYYNVPEELQAGARKYLDDTLVGIITAFTPYF